MKSLRILVVSIFIPALFTGCLRTRAQLREDGDDAGAKPQPAQVQDVQPQGSYALDEVRSEMTKLNGRIEDLERSKGQANADQAQNDKLAKLEARMTEMEQAQAAMIEAIKKMQQSGGASAANADPVELFDKGRIQVEGGENQAAIASLSSYLNAPKASRAEEATFLRGEAYFNEKNYKKAIIDFSKFTDKYAKSKRAPTAMYKIGQSFEALNMKQDARDFYADLVEKHPKSPEAKKAKAKLK